ncbi:MAG: hypothetical protein QM579_13815 [Desulfovibrio sp.]
MLFHYKTLQRRHGPPVQMLCPTAVPNTVCGVETGTRDPYWVLGNGKGHAFLADTFACAAALRQGQFIYISTSMIPNGDLCEILPPSTSIFLDMVLFNYCSLTLRSKEVVACLASNSTWEGRVWIKPLPDEPYPQKQWDLRRKLTVNRIHKHLIISANGYMYRCIAYNCRKMVAIPDDPTNNRYPEHFHYDCEEATFRSFGMMLRYWYNGLNSD